MYYKNGFLASISSDGEVSVWSVSLPDKTITLICTTNIGCRPTCVTIINLADFASDYVLKIEDGDEEIEEEKSAPVNKPKLNAQVGKVVAEVDDESDDDDSDEIDAVPQISNKKPNKKGQKNGSPSQNTSFAQKRKSLNNTTVTPNSAKKSKKSNKRQSSSNFVEQDNE